MKQDVPLCPMERLGSSAIQQATVCYFSNKRLLRRLKYILQVRKYPQQVLHCLEGFSISYDLHFKSFLRLCLLSEERLAYGTFHRSVLEDSWRAHLLVHALGENTGSVLRDCWRVVYNTNIGPRNCRSIFSKETAARIMKSNLAKLKRVHVTIDKLLNTVPVITIRQEALFRYTVRVFFKQNSINCPYLKHRKNMVTRSKPIMAVVAKEHIPPPPNNNKMKSTIIILASINVITIITFSYLWLNGTKYT